MHFRSSAPTLPNANLWFYQYQLLHSGFRHFGLSRFTEASFFQFSFARTTEMWLQRSLAHKKVAVKKQTRGCDSAEIATPRGDP
jgi:hypothetical protein